MTNTTIHDFKTSRMGLKNSPTLENGKRNRSYPGLTKQIPPFEMCSTPLACILAGRVVEEVSLQVLRPRETPPTTLKFA
jgi:hypothetical protein